MPNIYRITDAEYTFTEFNLLGVLDGHFEFLWNSESDSFKIRKIGDYANLTSYKEVTESFREMTPAELGSVEERLRKTLRDARHYTHKGEGDKLIPSEHYIVYANTVFDNRQNNKQVAN